MPNQAATFLNQILIKLKGTPFKRNSTLQKQIEQRSNFTENITKSKQKL